MVECVNPSFPLLPPFDFLFNACVFSPCLFCKCHSSTMLIKLASFSRATRSSSPPPRSLFHSSSTDDEDDDDGSECEDGSDEDD